MPLISLWKSNPIAVSEFTIEQVVSTAGDGSLKDGSPCSQELRDYFSQIPSEKLATYIDQCLQTKLEKGGLVLQDLINELGRRLDYRVTNGRYQGTSNTIGHDGIWLSPEGHALVIEVKTTDAYRLSLETLAKYTQRLIASGAVETKPSTLIVVGRQDTGELEAQVRGSRYAWDMRLISVEALIKLVTLKENSEEVETGQKIRSILTPVEYTRLDGLVDVMFTTAVDTRADHEAENADIELVEENKDTSESLQAFPGTSGWEFTAPHLLQKKREKIVKAASQYLAEPLIKKSRALYWSANHEKGIACTLSKRYQKRPALPYWYAYHPQWDEFLRGCHEGHLVLGCMDLEICFAIPHKVIFDVLPILSRTETERGGYWHLHLSEKIPGKFELFLPKSERNLPLSNYTLKLLSTPNL